MGFALLGLIFGGDFLASDPIKMNEAAVMRSLQDFAAATAIDVTRSCYDPAAYVRAHKDRRFPGHGLLGREARAARRDGYEFVFFGEEPSRIAPIGNTPPGFEVCSFVATPLRPGVSGSRTFTWISSRPDRVYVRSDETKASVDDPSVSLQLEPDRIDPAASPSR